MCFTYGGGRATTATRGNYIFKFYTYIFLFTIIYNCMKYSGYTKVPANGVPNIRACTLLSENIVTLMVVFTGGTTDECLPRTSHQSSKKETKQWGRKWGRRPVDSG